MELDRSTRCTIHRRIEVGIEAQMNHLLLRPIAAFACVTSAAARCQGSAINDDPERHLPSKEGESRVYARQKLPLQAPLSQPPSSDNSFAEGFTSSDRRQMMHLFEDLLSNFITALSSSEPPPTRETDYVDLANSTQTCVRLVDDVERSLGRANRYESNVTDDILDIEGMTGKKTRHFYNNLCAMDGARYLEIGTWKGSSICAAMCGNSMTCVANDNWAEFGGPKSEFLANFNAFKGQNRATFIEANCWELDPGTLGKFNIYMYDGNHDEESHFQALNHFMPCLDESFIYVVDDWNWDEVRAGTAESIRANHLSILYRKEIFTNGGVHPPNGPGGGDRAGKHGDWHNGIVIFVLKQPETQRRKK